MSAILARIKVEPVLASALVGATLALLVAFNVNLSDVQIAAVLGVVNGALALAVRASVTPLRRHRA